MAQTDSKKVVAPACLVVHSGFDKSVRSQFGDATCFLDNDLGHVDCTDFAGYSHIVILATLPKEDKERVRDFATEVGAVLKISTHSDALITDLKKWEREGFVFDDPSNNGHVGNGNGAEGAADGKTEETTEKKEEVKKKKTNRKKKEKTPPPVADTPPPPPNTPEPVSPASPPKKVEVTKPRPKPKGAKALKVRIPLAQFVSENADFNAPVVKTEFERLVREFKKKTGRNTTEGSVGVSYYRARKEALGDRGGTKKSPRPSKRLSAHGPVNGAAKNGSTPNGKSVSLSQRLEDWMATGQLLVDEVREIEKHGVAELAELKEYFSEKFGWPV